MVQMVLDEVELLSEHIRWILSSICWGLAKTPNFAWYQILMTHSTYLLVCLWISIVISSVCSPSVGFYKDLESNICTWTQPATVHYALSTRNIFSTQLCAK